jgi:protein-disulfide isomerase
MPPISSQPRYLLLILALPLLLACQTVTSLFRANVQSGDPPPLTPNDPVSTAAPALPIPAQPQADRYTQFNANFLGDPSAPVQVTEFGDFHCPYCKQFFDDHFGDLLADYIDTGIVYFSYRSAGEFLDGSGLVAEAAYCAEDQGAFWAYHDMIFARVDGKLEGRQLNDFAADLGLNTAAFADCLSSHKNGARVEMDALDFAEAGASGTPSFVVNGVLAVQGVNYPGLEAAIQAALGNEVRLPLALGTDPR